MSCNKVSDKGIISIAEALEINTELQVLNISYNSITDEGVLVIIEYLKSNTALQELRVSHNYVSVKGMISIDTTLEMNIALLHLLDISDTNISDDGAIVIGNDLKCNSTL